MIVSPCWPHPRPDDLRCELVPQTGHNGNLAPVWLRYQ
jgi:hypothetical protein